MEYFCAVIFCVLTLILTISGQVIEPIPGYNCYRCWGHVGGTKEQLLDIVKDKDLQPHYNSGCGLDFDNSTMSLKSRCTGESRCITKSYSFAEYTVYIRGCSATEDCKRQPEFAPYEYGATCCRGHLCNTAPSSVYATNHLTTFLTLIVIMTTYFRR